MVKLGVTILHKGSNRIVPPQPIYQFSSYARNWSRILMMEDGHYLRMPITPLNPTVESEWEALREEKIQWGGGSWTRENRITRELPAEVVRHMHYHLGSPLAERLLKGDIWSEVAPLWPENAKTPYEVSDWLSRCGYNGGIPLAQVQKNPPTWAQKIAQEEARRNAEREERIAAAVGSAEPLSEAERALGESLAGHDWSYQYSDDGQVWRRGHEHREELVRGLKALSVERRRIVWAAFAPSYVEEYWKCPE